MGTAIAEQKPQETRRLPAVITYLDDRKTQLAETLPAGLHADQFLRIVKNLCVRNPEILDCDPQSVYTACTEAAQDGLRLDNKEATIAIFNSKVRGRGGAPDTYVKKAAYIRMFVGLLKLVRQSGEVSSVSVNLVYANELKPDPETGKPRFRYIAGDDERIEHDPILFEERGDVVAAYSIVRMRDGGTERKVMNREEIDRIRQMAEKRKESTFWRDHFAEMAKKTVLRAHCKTLPMSTEAAQRIRDYDNEAMDAEEVTEDEGGEAPAQAAAPKRGRRPRGAAAAVLDQEPEGDGDETPHDPETGEIEDEAPPASESWNGRDSF